MSELVPGDILLVEGKDFWDRVIQWATVSPYNHVALVADGRLIEALVGGVTESPLDKYPPERTFHGRTDATWEELDAACRWAAAWVGRTYGWREALTSGARDVLHVPLRPRMFAHLDCSGLVAAAFASVRHPITRAIAPTPADIWASEVVRPAADVPPARHWVKVPPIA